MIPDDLQERLSALVSGDLSLDEANALRRQMRTEPEARRLYEQLCRDRTRLTELPHRLPPREFSALVLKHIGEKPIVQIPRRYQIRRSHPAWLAFVTAVGILAGMFFASRWMPRRPAESPAPTSSENMLADNSATDRPTSSAEETKPTLAIVPDLGEMPAEKTTANPDPPTVPRKPKPSDVLTSAPDPSLKPVQIDRPRISLPIAIKDLALPEVRSRLDSEIDRDRNHRIELFTRDTDRGLDEWQRALKARQIQMIIEPTGAEAHRRRLHGSYAIYCECLTAADLKALLRVLGPRTAQDAGRDWTFDNLVLTPIADSDRKELKAILGADPFDREAASKTEPRRPNSEKTVSEAARPAEAKAVQSRTVLATLYPPPRGLTPTVREVQQYLDRRSTSGSGEMLRLYAIIRAN